MNTANLTLVMIISLGHASGTQLKLFMQALEGLKLAERDANGGRRLTSQGRRDLDRIAAQIKAKKAAAVAAEVIVTA